ncbi:M23 family metallopeptidase [Helicobacter muridarum]|uniref:M23 family metallopeptidase n=1 Tax=Helicobacter muridarum TaxID=216 RepID=A0A099TZF9_9HELI|nr:M23 family metallopeptidase [Helicobacter muridarum]TLD99282.1 M23 family metallopeptidase [Helicobacter muridarum]STQ86128.1 putative M23/M37 family peptidase [Helicobacter muridarum]
MLRILFSVFFTILIFFCYLIFNTARFERIPPDVELLFIKDKQTYAFNSPFFNPVNTIKLHSFDSSGLLSYHIQIAKADGEILLSKDEVLTKRQDRIDVFLPQLIDYNLNNGDEIIYTVSVRDWSNANFFRGNTTTINKHLTISTELPKIQIISTSERITYGGSALIAFHIEDLPIYGNMPQSKIYNVHIYNGRHSFTAFPYRNKYGKTVYLCLVAWTLDSSFFDAEIHITDMAMNKQIFKIPLDVNINSIRHKRNIITSINDNYFDRIISRLDSAIVFPSNVISDVQKFQFLNESLRNEDNKSLVKFSKVFSNSISNQESSLIRFNNFVPVNFSNTSGRFGDMRTFNYHKESIASNTRFGIDLLDSIGSNVISSNNATLGFAGKFSSYGNLIMLNHALGLSSVYANLQEISNIEEPIKAPLVIGKVGNSTANLIDGIHFMLILQGHFINPRDWINKDWVDININEVLSVADNFGMKVF